MKKLNHSLGWNTVKKLERKNKFKNAIIAVLFSLLLFLSAIIGFSGGR